MVALEPSTGKILAMVSLPTLRPQPARLATTSTRSTTAYERLERRPRPSRCSTGRSRSVLPPGLDVQAGHRRGRARERPVHAGLDGAGRRRPRPAADHDRPVDRQRAAATAAATGSPFTQALEVSCNVSFGGSAASSAPTRCASRPRRSASTSDYLDDLHRQARAGFPRGPRRAADRAVRHRPVRRRRDPAADGDGRRRHRQRRHGDAALPRRRGPVARPRRPRARPTPRSSSAGDLAPPPPSDLTQMMVAVVDNGTAQPGRDPRRQGRRQDRHRAERADDRAAVRLVRLVRPGRRPAGRGRRARRGRRRRRATRSPAAAWPARSPRRSWRR